MVFQKRLDYGFDGYQVPPIPRSTRSTRKRGVNWRKADVNHICAFDLLATVAGNLLLEGENSPHSANTSSAREHSALMKDSIKEEKQNEEQTTQEKSCDQGSSERGFFLSELVSQAPMLSNCSSELPLAQNDTLSAPASVITSSDCSDKFATMEQLVNGGNKLELGSLNRKADIDVSGCKVFSNRKLGFEFGKPGSKGLVNDAITSADNKAGICIPGFPVLGNRKPSTLVCSDDSVKLTMPKDHISCVSFPVKRDDVKLGSRDDDENSSGCTQPSTTSKVFRQAQPYIEDRKSGKLSTPKYPEVNPKSNDEEHLNADVETRHGFDNSKNSFKHQRSLKDYPFKKRKLYDCSSVSISDVGIRNDGICSCPSKRYSGDASNYTVTLPTAHPVPGTSSSAAGESASFRSGDSQVKLRIKSFRIPELFIEIPETATVGSLKRTVMEAVTTILGGGVRVGVLFQGKKVRDDSKTLLQTGICHDNKLNAVGFTLEPNPSQDPPPPPVCPKEHPYLLSRDSPQPLSRYPSTPSVIHNAVQRGPNSALPNPRGTNVINFFESDHDSAPSPPDISLNKSAADSRALVAVPPGNAEALSVAPGRKPKRSETAQRRIRRPFSVSEVEALVQAVEKLGTGRWRDVKMRAFDNAKHRTYVDLKDKWKTLVHTARISPQQRRGEPVPQELLDRVLAAHAYWSQQQTKQQMKHHSATCFLL